MFNKRVKSNQTLNKLDYRPITNGLSYCHLYQQRIPKMLDFLIESLYHKNPLFW